MDRRFVGCIRSKSAQPTVSVDLVFVQLTVKRLEFLVRQLHIGSVQVFNDIFIMTPPYR